MPKLSIEHIERTSPSHEYQDDDWRCSDMFVGSPILFQLTPLFVCPIDARSWRRDDGGLQWKRPNVRPRNTWVRPVEFDIGMTADSAWNAAAERDKWRALRPALSERVSPSVTIDSARRCRLPRSKHRW